MIALIAAIGTIAIAICTLIGWQFDNEALKRVFPNLVAMNPATAVGFICAAIGLVLMARGDRSAVVLRIGRALAGGAALTGVLKLVSLLVSDVGVDQWLFSSKLDGVNDALPNRMAPNTALCFVMIGLAVALIDWRTRWRQQPAQLLAVATAFLALVAIIGYAYSVTSLYGVGSFIPMALHTAVGFLALSIGALAARTGEGAMALITGRDAGGMLARRLLPAVILIPPALGWLRLTGERMGFFDGSTGVSLLIVSTMLLFIALIWHTAGLLGDFERSLRRLAAIVESSHDAVISEDLEGRILSWNLGAESLFGYRADEILGQPISLLVPAENPDEVPQLIARIIRGEQVNHYETVRIAKDGRRLDISLTLSPIYDEQDRVVGVSKIARDITDQKRGEAELARAKLAAEDSNRTKSEFLANMSHEIRTPMMAIVGYTDLLADANQTHGQRLERVNVIRRNADHLLTLINDILDLSKIEAGEMVTERVRCSPCQVLSDVVSLMRVKAEQKSLALKTHVDGVIPETIQTDPTRLRQVLLNLVSNAIKFTDSGQVRITSRLIESRPGEGSMLEFRVSDSGIGLTDEQMGRLFRPFTQADSSTTRRFGGTGLGLAISQRLAHMLGGRIEVHSRPGQGSTFTLTIATGPLDGVKRLHDCSEAVLTPEPADYPMRRVELSGRILLVEDGADNRALLALYLRMAGTTVSEAENGQVACDLVDDGRKRGESFDLIIIDMQMPVLDGYSATRSLRAGGFEGPIIALTAHAMPEDRKKCLDAGCTDYLSKPVSRDLLLCTVAAHLPAQHSSTRSAHENEGGGANDRLTGSLTDPVLRSYLDAFLTSLANRAQELESQLVNGEMETLAEVVHQLKGSGGLFGFPAISQQAAVAEDAIQRRRSLERVSAEVRDLIGLMHRATRSANERSPAGT